MYQTVLRLLAVLFTAVFCVSLFLSSALSPAIAGTIVVEGAQSWEANINEDQRHATITETIGPGPGPVLKKFLNVNTPGVWSTTVIATNNSGQTWVDYHFDILFPPPQMSVANDGVDFTIPQPGGNPCATIGLPQVCSGTWTVMSDSLWVQFNQGQATGVVNQGQTVTMVFNYTITSPPANLPVNFTLAQHFSVPEPETAGHSVAGAIALLACCWRCRRPRQAATAREERLFGYSLFVRLRT